MKKNRNIILLIFISIIVLLGIFVGVRLRKSFMTDLKPLFMEGNANLIENLLQNDIDMCDITTGVNIITQEKVENKKENIVAEKNTTQNKAKESNSSKTIEKKSNVQKETTKKQIKKENTSINAKKEENTTPKVEKKTGKTPYYIKVNLAAQVVTIYKKDKDGYYTVPYKAMICSSGTDTPKSGIYKIPGRWNWGGLVGNVYGQYITVITGQILFHSVPYTERYNPGSLQYEEYDKLGTPASHGCIRLTVEDALWIHKNCTNGTQVEFYSSSNPGPLGKPTIQKISNASEELRGWDPSDPNPSNPWRKK